MGKVITYSEKFIRWIWEQQRLKKNLKTQSGAKLRIIYPGALNQQSGPDFKGAVIDLNGKETRGSVEVHLKSSDWFQHQHQTDPKYNKVCLHVVLKDTKTQAVTENKRPIETLEISNYLETDISLLFEDYKKSKQPCHYTDSITLLKLLENAGIARFEQRKQRFKRFIKDYGEETALYVAVMESMGYVNNEKPFRKLAKLVSLSKIKSLIACESEREKILIIQTLLLGTAGLIPKNFQTKKLQQELKQCVNPEEWELFKVRPRAFPMNRILGMSYFLSFVVETGLSNFLISTFPDIQKLEQNLVQNSITKSCARTTILNVFLPFLSILIKDKSAVMNAYKNYKSLPTNSRIRLMKNRLSLNKVPDKEIYQQGMIHIYKHYCKLRNCNRCLIYQSKQQCHSEGAKRLKNLLLLFPLVFL